ncbi:hypothetical protein BC477_18285 [Clavibacter michiganensis subsp. michiganensis]|uniref:Uncharacterized protein n=1 Tax=Clavibacter michiganensis subsp. michiganensis TaxID=33013 RepID=A0A251XG70_CLAMM|nr:hypothetical protein BC477_18285 [Clavibacter michiganensis subsp. michiganensis]OUE01431.1 hypothetical protein CMMCAS07_14070 [Clavibacter michiganensis subsp. michiganensis]
MPESLKNAYAANAATISGRTHAAMTKVPTIARTTRLPCRMRSASPRPTTFCPTTAEKKTNASVRSTDFGKSGSANSAV